MDNSADPGKKTKASPTVTFSNKPKVLYPVPASSSRQQRRRTAQQKLRDDARLQQNIERIKGYADQLTPQNLIIEVNRYVRENLEEQEINKQISGVPDNGQVFQTWPVSYCTDCVDTIASYFKDEDLAKCILKDDDDADEGIEEPVLIKDVNKLATWFLTTQNYNFYDHVTVEAFNDKAMESGGTLHDIPLNVACLLDAAVENGLYEQLAGKETLCAAFSTGVAMQCGISDSTESSENNFKTHKQLLTENVDPNTISSGCSCLKSTKWLKKRISDERKMKKLMPRGEKGHYWRWMSSGKMTTWTDDDSSSCADSDEQEDDSEKKDSNEETAKCSDEEDSDSEVEVVFEQRVKDYDEFRPGNLVQRVEKEEDFDNTRWSDMRTTSTCLALCRHTHACVVNSVNKKRVLDSLLLARLTENNENRDTTIASTTPGEYFTMIIQPMSFLMFSLGATVYEAMARRVDDSYDTWGPEMRKTIAKVYATVHTVAIPFFRSAPVCYIDQQNKYGYYKTFRIRVPGNFSGCYNDPSIGWRSELYSRIVNSAVRAECGGHKTPRSSFSKSPWQTQKPIKIEGGLVYDHSGDMSGNYLTYNIAGFGEEEQTAIAAYANMMNLTAVHKAMAERVFGDLLTVKFKQLLVEAKTIDIERTQKEQEAEGEQRPTVHEIQNLITIHTNLIKKIKFMAETIRIYNRCLKYLEIDLGTMNKHLSCNLKGYAALAPKLYANSNFYSYYV